MSGKYWDKAWSLVEGCTPVSPACDNCWLASIEHRFGVTKEKGITGSIAEGTATGYEKITPSPLTYGNGRFNGTVRICPDRLDIPLKRKKPTVYAVWSDLFHEDVPFSFVNSAIGVMSSCPQHTFLVLTKRPERAQLYFKNFQRADIDLTVFLPKIWLGVTAENQEQADKRIPILLQIPAAKRFVSIEPMLGPIDLINIEQDMSKGNHRSSLSINSLTGVANAPIYMHELYASLDLVILGGESGHGARPMHPDWVRKVRDDCVAAGVPFFFKQWGEWSASEPYPAKGMKPYKSETVGNTVMFRCGLKKAGRLLNGREWNGLPWGVKV